MQTRTTHLARAAVAGLLALAASGPSQAAITTYTTQAAFLAAVSAPGVDTFADLSVTQGASSPMNRSAGAYGYTASAPDGFFGAGSAGDPWLSTDTSADPITFSNFSSQVRGVGGLFFGSNADGAFMSGSLTVVATDASGATASRTFVGGLSSFTGFISNVAMTSVVITAAQPGGGFMWPTVDNLTLAVPEPGSYALLLCGLAVVGWLGRRKA